MAARLQQDGGGWPRSPRTPTGPWGGHPAAITTQTKKHEASETQAAALSSSGRCGRPGCAAGSSSLSLGLRTCSPAPLLWAGQQRPRLAVLDMRPTPPRAVRVEQLEEA